MPIYKYTHDEIHNPVKTLTKLRNDLMDRYTKAQNSTNLEEEAKLLNEAKVFYEYKMATVGDVVSPGPAITETDKKAAGLFKEIKAMHNDIKKTQKDLKPQIELIKQQKEEEDAEKNKKIKKIIAKVDSLLDDLSKKIDTIGNNFSAAKTEAKTLHTKLEAARDVYVKELAAILTVPGSAKNLFDAAAGTFKNTCKTAITQAMDILDKDLGWGEYLKNLLKSIANAVVYLVTVGNRHEFFPYAKSESSKNVAQIGEKLQAHDKDESQNTEEEQHQSTPTPNPTRG